MAKDLSLFLDPLSGTHYHYPLEKHSVLQLLKQNLRLIFFTLICPEVQVLVFVCITQEVSNQVQSKFSLMMDHYISTLYAILNQAIRTINYERERDREVRGRLRRRVARANKQNEVELEIEHY